MTEFINGWYKRRLSEEELDAEASRAAEAAEIEAEEQFDRYVTGKVIIVDERQEQKLRELMNECIEEAFARICSGADYAMILQSPGNTPVLEKVKQIARDDYVQQRLNSSLLACA
jgi:hypothetical protein